MNSRINSLCYLYGGYQSCIFVTKRKKVNASSLIQIKVKHDKTKANGVEIIFNIKL